VAAFRGGGILYSLPQKLLAEFIGTFAIVFTAAGVICADQYLRAAGQASPGLLGYAFAYGLVTAGVVSALGHVSGAHLNPAITIGSWVTKRLGTLPALFYCVAQLAGATAAGYLLIAILPEAAWRPVSLGATDLAPDFTRMHGMVLEGLATFFVVLVYFAAAFDAEGAFRQFGSAAVGLTVTAGVLLSQPFTGASLNPARTFGPALAAHHWINHGVYWIGPLFGGLLGAVVFDRLFARDPLAI
jgi:MIP family channel proteins